MAGNFDYREQRNRMANEKVRDLLTDLPPYVQTFLVGREGKMSPQTRSIYTSRIDLFFQYLVQRHAFGDRKKQEITLSDLESLKIEDIELFMSWIRHGNSSRSNRKTDNRETTVNNYLSALNTFYNYFLRRGKISVNPVAGVERGRVRKHDVIRLDDRQKDQFFHCIETGEGLTVQQKRYHDKTALRDQTICLVLARTGLRVSELVGLDVDHIDFTDCSLTVLRKGNKYDHLFFDDEVAALLEEYLEYRKTLVENDPTEKALFLVTFGKYKGTRISVRTVERLVKKYAVAGAPTAGSRISPHKLRATYATDMLRATNNIVLVQQALNHESPRTTMVYTDTRTINLQNARNVLADVAEDRKKQRRKKASDPE